MAFGRPWDDPAARHPWVDVDGRAGVELATDHLVERGHPPDRLDRLAARAPSSARTAAAAGLERMHEHGLSTSRRRRAATTPSSSARARRTRCSTYREERPTAFLCASDTVAMGVLRSLAELGLRPGRDLAVVGFDDSIAAQVSTPALTSVRQPLEQVAVEVVRYLGELLAHRPIPEPGSC